MVEYGHRDTLLAIAAYNSGPYKLHGILKRNGLQGRGPGTFWELYRRRLLPRESVNLVVRVVALTTMAVERLGLPTAPALPAAPSGVTVSARELPRTLRAVVDGR